MASEGNQETMTTRVGLRLSGPFSEVFSGSGGPSHAQINTALQNAMVDSSKYNGMNKQAKVLQALSEADDETARLLATELVEMLQYLFRDDPSDRGMRLVRKMTVAVEKAGGKLTASGALSWNDSPGEKPPTEPRPVERTGDAAHSSRNQPLAEVNNTRKAAVGNTSTVTRDRIFLVHGHDTAFRNEVKLWLRDVGLEPITLAEEASGGKHLFEKLEHYAGQVGYAIILATPDDVGRAAGVGDLKPRARQNVIFEMGYFVAKLGRGKVAVITVGDIERPSDIDGLVYISKDGPWMEELRRELHAAEFTLTR